MHGAPELFTVETSLTWAVVTGALIALQCALLSVLVVLKRMAFIGQGVSHAALGGVGVAALLGVTHGPAWFVIVGGACILSAMLVCWLRDRRTIATDTAIGIVLVASMALGVTLLAISPTAADPHADHAYADHDHHQHDHDHAHAEPAHAGHDWESLLFGSLTDVGPLDALVAGGLLLVTGFLALRYGRAVLFWAFDESAAGAFGAPTRAAELGLLIALAATIVASMKLVGIILATAMLVLPGACALRLCSRLPGVIAASIITALIALAVGLLAARAAAVPVGGAVVLTLTLCYALTWPISRLIPNPAPPPQTTPERTAP